VYECSQTTKKAAGRAFRTKQGGVTVAFHNGQILLKNLALLNFATLERDCETEV